MADVASVVVPLFGLVLLGGLAGQSTVLARNGRRVIDWLLFRFALPALVLDSLAHSSWTDIANWPFFLTLIFGTYCAFAVSFTLSALRNGGDIRRASIDGAIGSHGSLGHLAPALLLLALGPVVAVPVAVILVLDNLLIRLLLPALWAIDGRDRQPAREVVKRIGRLIVDQPMIPAALLGAGLAAGGVGIPSGINEAVALLGSAAAPLGLVGWGLAMAAFRSDDGGDVRLKWNAAIATKLIVHPIVVYLLLSWAGNFDPAWMFAAILLSALPPSTGLHAIARGSARPEPMDVSAATGTLLSVVSVTVWLILISEGVVSADPFF